MRMTEIKCPNCDANLQIDSSLKYAFCQYCGTKVAMEATETYNQYEQPVASRLVIETLGMLAEEIPNREALTKRYSIVHKQIEFLQKNLKRLEKYEYKTGYLIGLIVSCIFVAVLFVAIGNIENPPSILSLLMLLSMASTGVFAYIYSQCSTKKNSAIRLEKDLKEEEQLKMAIDRVNAAIDHADEELLPPMYRDTASIIFIYNALVNQRATTVKEAINLYEQDKQNKKMEELQTQQLQKLEAIKRQQQNIELMQMATLLNSRKKR